MISSVSRFCSRGVTLVELIVSIVIISVALSGIFVVLNRYVFSSADPMVQHQAAAIAEAYLEEILLKNFCDPDNAVLCTSGAPGTANCPATTAPEASRDLYDNVYDYHNTNDSPPKKQDGSVVNALTGYQVQVAVATDATADLGGLLASNCQVLRVNVTVTAPNNVNFSVSGYRTNYQ